MGITWTADRDQKLFLLLVDQIKVDGNALAAAWKAKYGKWMTAKLHFHSTTQLTETQ
jgi:hypothetical protein